MVVITSPVTGSLEINISGSIYFLCNLRTSNIIGDGVSQSVSVTNSDQEPISQFYLRDISSIGGVAFTGGRAAVQADVNNRIMTLTPSSVAVAIDTANCPNMTDPTNTLYYQVDGTHPTQLGCTTWGNFVYLYIQALYN